MVCVCAQFVLAHLHFGYTDDDACSMAAAGVRRSNRWQCAFVSTTNNKPGTVTKRLASNSTAERSMYTHHVLAYNTITMKSMFPN